MTTKATFKVTCQIGKFIDLQNRHKTVTDQTAVKGYKPIHHIHVCNRVVKYIYLSW